MKFYGVTTRFYDDGKVKAKMFEIEAKEMPEAEYEETSTCDIYVDYFTSEREANQYLQDALNA